MSTATAHNTIRFWPHQKEDIARAAIHDGLVLGWDPGLGKTFAMFTYPQLKAAMAGHVPLRCLIVAPESLHPQIIEEAIDRFGITVRPLNTQEQFHTDPDLQQVLCDHLAGRESKVTCWRITSYSQLGYNGGDEWPPEEDEKGNDLTSSKILKQRAAEGTVGRYEEGIGTVVSYPAPPRSKDLPPSGQSPAAPLDVGCSTLDVGRSVLCVNHPTLATLLTSAGDLFNAVVCDEAVRLKSNDSYTSLGVRRLNPQWRLVLTGTPIKNFLDDFFWLAQWASGGSAEATGRWPYAATNEAREEFANAHMVIEQNHTKERAAAEARIPAGRELVEEHGELGYFTAGGSWRKVGGRSYKKRVPQLTNLHRLWKLLGPVVIRRRKEDIGSIVPKTIIPIRVKPGTAQHLVYKTHIQHPPKYTKDGNPMNPIPQILAQLTNLRLAALCPGSDLLSPYRSSPPSALSSGSPALPVDVPPGDDPVARLRAANLDVGSWTLDVGRCERSESDVGRCSSPTRSWTDWTPKLAACLSLIEKLLSEGQRVVIMSPFQSFSAHLYAALRSANVATILLDGDTSPLKRGKLAADFKAGRYAVLIGGILSMGEGHSFQCASHLILPSLDWAMDKNAQAEDRVHRLNSPHPVSIYCLITEGTVDERLASGYQEKSDASHLALDGRLIEAKQAEVNLSELLRNAIADFDDKAQTIDEQDLEKDWERSGRARLSIAMTRFREFHPPIVPDTTGQKITRREHREEGQKLTALQTRTAHQEQKRTAAWAALFNL